MQIIMLCMYYVTLKVPCNMYPLMAHYGMGRTLVPVQGPKTPSTSHIHSCTFTYIGIIHKTLHTHALYHASLHTVTIDIQNPKLHKRKSSFLIEGWTTFLL